jgi:hypothetical protein
MINIRRISAKSAGLLLIAVGLITPATGCSPALSANLPTPENPAPPPPISSGTAAPAVDTQPPAEPGNIAVSNSENISQPLPGRTVEIIKIHNRGTLTKIGCCNPLFYELDEFVVIRNRGDTSQNIAGWSLTNVTRGYPTFRFPTLFPCIPYEILSAEGEPVTYSTEPLDETPMKPANGLQGIPVPCTLYPGQTILVFTDEVHCSSGGFSFNWAQGNIWNNEATDTAVLYNSAGKEVSRRSYTVGSR